MNAISFDTHTIARRYKAAGFTDDQVEAMVETAREAASLPDLSHLGTKADFNDSAAANRSEFASVRSEISELRVATRTDLIELRADLKSDIALARQQLSDAKVQLIMATVAIVGFADGLLFFLLRR